MNENDLLNELKLLAKGFYIENNFFHDFAHIKNVCSNIEILLMRLKKGDRLVLLTAALFHDIYRTVKNHHSNNAITTEKILLEVKDFPNEKISEIIKVISGHKINEGNINQKIFYDADKMDAFTTLGLFRGIMICASEGKNIEDSVIEYENLLSKWYNNLNFEVSKKMVKKDYEKAINLINEVKRNYQYI